MSLLKKVVMKNQAKLVTDWMRVGFIHGVMNTDNMTISGETIDYGPCAFMNALIIQKLYLAQLILAAAMLMATSLLLCIGIYYDLQKPYCH